jgi:hypothetical protein
VNETSGSQQNTPARGVATGIVAGAPVPGPEHRRLQAIIGKWINQGHTVASPAAPAVEILSSDVYDWMPGGFFVLHTAYGLIGDTGVGGTEIIGYDPETMSYFNTFYDSQGNVMQGKIEIEGDTWRHLHARTRATAVFSDGDTTQTVLHERSDDGIAWQPSMEIVLRKVS